MPSFHFTTSELMNIEVYALPLPSNSVCSGPSPGFCTSPARIASYLRTGIPSTVDSNCFSAIAFASFVNECTGITVASLPPATMYSPVGSTSTPCGDFGVGR